MIVFGREATIEHPPFADEIRSVGMLESLFELRTDATNIASALKLAQASFPEDTAKRIVIVTDGNENLGDARTIARTLADDGIGIDVVPIELALAAGSRRRKDRPAPRHPPRPADGGPRRHRQLHAADARPTPRAK